MNKEFYKFKTDVIKALANPIRLMIVDCLKDGEKNVSELIAIIEEEQSNISKHLAVLKNQGFIKDRKAGLNVYYSLKICCIKDFFGCLDEMISENIRNQKALLDSSIN